MDLLLTDEVIYMSKRQFGLAAIAILLLSPNLVYANETNQGTSLTVGNIHITKTGKGTSIKTPKIQIETPKATDDRMLLSRSRRRSRTQIRRKRISAPTTIRPHVDPNDDEPKIIRTPTMPSVPKVPSVPQSTIRTPTVRSSTIRTTSDDNDSHSVSEQHQSIQCSGSGSSVSQSSTTINGRTVNSEVRSNCQ